MAAPMYRKTICRLALWLLLPGIGAVAAWLLLWLAHTLPTQNIRDNIRWWVLEERGMPSLQLPPLEGSLRGIFTDALMLHYAAQDLEGTTALRQSLELRRGEVGEGEGWAAGDSLAAYLSGESMPRQVTYARYWHGYLVILKPLLFLSNLAMARLFFALVNGILPLVYLWLCAGRGCRGAGLLAVVSGILLYPFFLSMSFSLSFCHILLWLFLTVQLAGWELWQRRRWQAFLFLVFGMVTAYLDLLTYPLVLLGFPLAMQLYLSSGVGGLRRRLAELAQWMGSWFWGYAGLWTAKWALAYSIGIGGIWEDGLATVGRRMGGGAWSWSALSEALRVNWGLLAYWPIGILLASVLVWGLWRCLGLWKGRGGRIAWSAFLPYALVAALPLAWTALSLNHSLEHFMYTGKIWSISVFALALGALSLGTEGGSR